MNDAFTHPTANADQVDEGIPFSSKSHLQM